MTVCLCMIVKDEAPVIRRCLDSVRPIIDRWVIVDTGSTDGTQAVVREHLAGIPGTLIERPWVDFAHNRSEALGYARGTADYLFVIDADEVLELDEGFMLPRLEADSYAAEMRYGGCTYLRRVIVRGDLPWRYRGVVHEYLECPEARSEAFMPGLRIVPHRDGARARDPHTYRRDALAIETALIDEPDNERYVFYLAQSYRDAGDLELAVRHYRRRAEMGGWPEEVWYSLYQVAQLRERMGHPWPEVMEDYLRAHEARPDRAGPMFRIGVHYQQAGRHQLAHVFLSAAARVPYPAADRLFVERPLYEYGIAVEYAVACHYAGDYESAIETDNALLRGDALPAELIERVVANRRFSVDALAGPAGPRTDPHVTVVVEFRDPGPELDDCVESLLRQEPGDFAAVFLDRGSREDHSHRLPLEDDRFTLRRSPLGELVAELPGDEVVFAIAADQALTAPGAVRALAEPFADARCVLAYGRHRDAGGALAPAEPAASSRAFAAAGLAAAGASPLAFRASLLAEAGAGREQLWRAAGLDGTRFSDEVLTVSAARAPAASRPVRARATEPFVSCLLVTRDRLALAKRAMRSFAEQTHSRRELVVVTDGEPRFRRALERAAAALGVDGVRFVFPDEDGWALGALRNLSLDEARGDVVCQWDDDDYSHPERLERQLAELRRSGAAACLMTDHLQLHERERLVFWVDWTDSGRIAGIEQFAPGTLMMVPDSELRYPADGPYARAGEDSVLLAALAERAPLAPLRDAGHLWLYTFHGRNTFPADHHRRMSAFGAPRSFLVERSGEIRAALARYPIPRPAVVAGRDGPAFAVR
jgi:glycosyltransferase involved in cell wall biosynthesis